MFFTKKATVQKSELELSTEKMISERATIKNKLKQVEEICAKVGEACTLTREDSAKLSSKVTSELKVARKSLTSFSSRLREGMLMLDHSGKITHLNKRGSLIISAKEKDVLGCHLSQIISCANDVHDADGKVVLKPILREKFFENLSTKIFEKIKDNHEKYMICNEILRAELPFCFEGGIDDNMWVTVIREGKSINLHVSLSVLDNDPEDIKDLTYILLFND